MDVTVDASLPARIIVGASGVAGLAQEIRTVLATRRGSVPMDRDFGVAWDLVDQPMPSVRPMLIAEIARALEANVPRIKVKDIRFGQKARDTVDGLMRPTVTVTIREEYRDAFRR
jgi:phage baseplate assembly protein W